MQMPAFFDSLFMNSVRRRRTSNGSMKELSFRICFVTGSYLDVLYFVGGSPGVDKDGRGYSVEDDTSIPFLFGGAPAQNYQKVEARTLSESTFTSQLKEVPENLKPVNTQWPFFMGSLHTPSNPTS